MNEFSLVGRLARDVELRYAAGSQKPFAWLTVACDNGRDKEGNDLPADFITVTAFNKTAENADRYLRKGSLVAVKGRIRITKIQGEGGKDIYKTNLYVDKLEYLADYGSRKDQSPDDARGPEKASSPADDIPSIGDDDIPF